MSRKEKIHQYIEAISVELLDFIKEREPFHSERWVPSTEIKESLELNFAAVPKENKQYGPKGWLFAIIARLLEDKSMVEYKKTGNRSYYRSK